MTDIDLRAALLNEQYGHPTPEWHPTDEMRAAADRRTEITAEGLADLEAAS